MFEKKKLMINCEICDARKIAEEDYAKFESIVLNTEILFVNDRARGILARLPVTMNAAETIELPEGKGIDMRVYNGSSQLGPDDFVSENTMIIANGSLQLLPGAQETVARCYKIIVNGSLRCPQSMAGCLGRISCNGKTDVYPDDAVVLDKKYVMDRFFPLRARQDAKYYAEKQILIGDGALDAAKLAAKNVSFITKKLVVPEALVEPLAPLFDVNTEFEVVPEGYAIVPDSADLDEALLQKYGRSLYVCGDLDIGIEAKELIAGLERLIVTGCVSMPKSCKAAFDALHAQCGSIELVKGKVVGNAVSLTIDRRMLDNAPDGVTVHNAAMIRIDAEITPEEIVEKLDIKNAALIKCSPEQRGAVSLVAKNAAHISSGGEEDEQGEGAPTGMLDGIMGGLFGGVKALMDTKLINAETHIL